MLLVYFVSVQLQKLAEIQCAQPRECGICGCPGGRQETRTAEKSTAMDLSGPTNFVKNIFRSERAYFVVVWDHSPDSTVSLSVTQCHLYSVTQCHSVSPLQCHSVSLSVTYSVTTVSPQCHPQCRRLVSAVSTTCQHT